MTNVAPHLLLVDDEMDFISTAQLLLEMEGFRVTASSSSAEAVAWIREGLSPDVVLLDYRMPQLTGPEALRVMREIGLKAPAVLISAMNGVREVATENGFDAYIAKPFGMSDLLELVRKLLAKAT